MNADNQPTPIGASATNAGSATAHGNQTPTRSCAPHTPAEQQAEYEADMWRQYTTDLWAVALAAGEIQLAQPGGEVSNG